MQPGMSHEESLLSFQLSPHPFPYTPLPIPLLPHQSHFPPANSKIFGKTGVPKPVTASHPSTAENPVVLHPALNPLTISVNPLYPVLYNHGFKKPRGGLPEDIRASLTSARMEDIRGVEADVPEMMPKVPFQT
jgi:hypothetical protein